MSTKNSVSITSPSALLGRLLDRTLDAHELGATYLRRTAETIFKDLTRAPHRLPPSIKIPGRRGRVWLESEVLRWLKEHQQEVDVSPVVNGTSRQQVARPAQSAQEALPRQVGRPTKLQQRQRQAQQLVAREAK